jgi:hypothetical protein
MEALLNTFPHQSCSKVFAFDPKIVHKLPMLKLRTGFFTRKPELGFVRRNCINLGRVSHGISSLSLDDDDDDGPLDIKPPKKRKEQQKSKLLEDSDGMDWCMRAREVALKSIEARGLTRTMEDLITVKKKKKNKNKKFGNKEKVKKKREEDLYNDSADEFELQDMGNVDDADVLRRNVSMLSGGMFEEKREKTMEEFVQRLSQFSGPSDRRKEINLNKAIVEAQTAEEVLEVAAETIVAVGKGLSPSPLSPLNIATALHRIAKNMEKVSMMETRRLAFARQREMCMLVGIAMKALPECSAQGISNISWALSKIGGELLYLSEMDRVAEVAFTKVG